MHIIHCHSLTTLAPVCLLCSGRDLVCNTPSVVVSLVTRHSSHPRPCHSYPCCVVMSVHAQSMQPMRPGEVSVIITSLHCGAWCLWCGVHSHHCSFPFTHCIICWMCHMWCLHDCMMMCCLIECGLSALTVTHKERGEHTGVLVWCVVCAVWCVVCEVRVRA